ncbi:MAG: hypothetical protein ACR2HC_08630 [Thermoleophilaceae bacterium]
MTFREARDQLLDRRGKHQRAVEEFAYCRDAVSILKPGRVQELVQGWPALLLADRTSQRRY